MIQAAAVDQSGQKTADIVIIDDDSMTLEIVGWVLRYSKSTYQLFSDPDVAMAHLCESLPRILIVDYYMPKINGIDFIRKLGADIDLTFCDIYLCSAIEPTREQLVQLRDLGISKLDKMIICDRNALLALVESDQQSIGNERNI